MKDPFVYKGKDAYEGCNLIYFNDIYDEVCELFEEPDDRISIGIKGQDAIILDQHLVKELLPFLQTFAETGSLVTE
jgi:hypothetical protein